MVGEFGDENLKGIIPRSFDYMFTKIKESQEKEKSKYVISIAFIQLYLEAIQDLFEPNNHPVLREDPETGVYLDGVKWIRINNTKECYDEFKKGEKNRITECTRMNASSSRSHALLIAKVEKKYAPNTKTEHVMTRSYLYLVDLAGSERLAKSGSKEMRLEEAKKINVSLLALGNCIQALSNSKNSHVSYRNSKLTRILQESLGGNAKTSLIVTISPSSYNSEETFSTLAFGSRAMKVQNKPVINKAEDFQEQCTRVKNEYDQLLEQYNKLKSEYDAIIEQNDKVRTGEFNGMHLSNSKFGENSMKTGLMEKERKDIVEYTKKEMKEKYEAKIKELTSKNKKSFEKLTNDYAEVSEKAEKYKQQSETIIKGLKGHITDLKNQKEKVSTEFSIAAKDVINLNKALEESKMNFQKIKMDFTKEKEENEKNKQKLETLTTYLKDIDKKKSNCKSVLTQTEPLISLNVKETLFSMKISKDDINQNKYEKIVNQLIVHIDNLNNQNISSLEKLKTMDEMYYEQIEKSSKEKELLEQEIIRLKDKNKTIKDKRSTSKSKDNNNNTEELISSLKSQINKLKDELANKNESIEMLVNEMQKQRINTENSNKILRLNKFNIDSEKRKLFDIINQSEKTLNKCLVSLNYDLNFSEKYLKNINKIDKLIEKEILISSTLKTFELSLHKLQKEKQDVKKQVIDFLDLDITKRKNIDNINLSDLILQFQEITDKNRENTIIIAGFHNKLIEIFIKYLKLYNRFGELPDNKSKYNDRESNHYNQTPTKLAAITFVEIMLQQLTKFAGSYANININDLIEQLNSILNGYESIQIFFKLVGTIFEAFIDRIVISKQDKDEEIGLLNEQLIFLLREIALCRNQLKDAQKNIVSSHYYSPNNNEPLNQQLELKIQENDTLKKQINELQEKVKLLRSEHDKLKKELLYEKLSLNTSFSEDLMNTTFSSKHEERNHSADIMKRSKKK